MNKRFHISIKTFLSRAATMRRNEVTSRLLQRAKLFSRKNFLDIVTNYFMEVLLQHFKLFSQQIFLK